MDMSDFPKVGSGTLFTEEQLQALIDAKNDEGYESLNEYFFFNGLMCGLYHPSVGDDKFAHGLTITEYLDNAYRNTVDSVLKNMAGE